MKFNTPFLRNLLPGEINSEEQVTEPGQAFTTREIYERYLVTGRVEGIARRSSYDSDELGRDPNPDDLIERPLDLTDIDKKMEELYKMRAERVAKAQKEELAKRTASQGSSAANDAVSSPKGE